MNVVFLRKALDLEPDLEFAVLIGSRADGSFRPDSDWDIAVRWTHGISFLEGLDKTETLRRTIAGLLKTTESSIDIIDLSMSRLAIRAVAAEEGIPLKGEDSLHWSHFLRRTWRELEEHYWEKLYAA